MSVSESRLLEVLAESVAAARAIGVDPVLVGAFAIRVRAHAQSPPPVTRLDDPAVLARMVQATADLDLVVERPHDVGTALTGLGFRRVPNRPVVYLRGDDEVDVIPGRPTRDSIHVPLAAIRADALPVPEPPGVLVAEPGALVVMKAVAWRDRHEERDLADIAALAIGAAVTAGPISLQLGRTVRAWPDSAHALRDLARRFGDRDLAGPIAFAKVVSALARPTLDEWEAVEEAVRGLASDAVRMALRDYR